MVFQEDFELNSAEETFDWAKRLGKVLSFPFVIFLSGDLGAGKTLITSGIVRGLGFKDQVSSPTYTIVNEYDEGGKKVYHFDLYRLANQDELYEMGFEDYLFEGAGLIFEWPDLIDQVDFDRLVKIRIETFMEAAKKRQISVMTKDRQLAQDLKKLR